MNDKNRKLIGTIIGVVFFAILVIGATFAWFTYTANVTNGAYNTKTLNFVVTYTNGSDVTKLPILSSDATSQDFDLAGGEARSGKAYRGNVEGTLFLKLHINDTPDNDTLVSSGCIRYIALYSAFNVLVNPNDVLSNFESIGVVNQSAVNSNGDVIMYQGELQSRSQLNTPEYRIYLWLDGECVTNDYLGLTFSGYIHASAIQSDPDR